MKINYWYVPGIKRREREVYVWEVINAVAEFHNEEPASVRCGKGKKYKYKRMRQVVMYVMGKHGKVSQEEIGKYFGLVQSNVSLSIKRVESRLDWDGELRDCVEWVEYRLFGRADSK